MGLILITSILIFILILDALRNQISIHLKYNYKTKQNKERNKETKRNQIELSTTEYYKPFHVTGQLIWKKEKEPPEHESITENTEEDTLLTTEEQPHQTEQEIKDLQGTVKSLQNEITTHYSLMKD